MCAPRSAWERCVEFHGHACPGLAIGFRASEAAADKMKLTFSKDEELVCVVENDACGVDAVQVLMGCSFGKGNLIYRDRGKQAFSFFNRNTRDKVRIVFKQKPNWEGMDSEAIQDYILRLPLEELFDFNKPSFAPPVEACIFKSIVCEECGESAAEHKMRLQAGKKVCLDCFSDYTRGW